MDSVLSNSFTIPGTYISEASASAPYSSYTAASITANPYEQVKAEIDKQLAENQNPPGNEEGSASTTDPENPDNNLERIILSVIIAILCVAVVLLIFRPGKKKKASADTVNWKIIFREVVTSRNFFHAVFSYRGAAYKARERFA